MIARGTITVTSVLIVCDGWGTVTMLDAIVVITGPVLAMDIGHVFAASLAGRVAHVVAVASAAGSISEGAARRAVLSSRAGRGKSRTYRGPSSAAGDSRCGRVLRCARDGPASAICLSYC